MIFEKHMLVSLVPELFLMFSAILLLLAGVFRKENQEHEIGWVAVIAMSVSFYLASIIKEQVTEGFFISNSFTVFMKQIILAVAIASVALSQDWFNHKVFRRFEFPVLLMLATSGMMFMVSASGFIPLYIGMELTGIPLYLIAAYKRAGSRSSEAGIKHFTAGMIATGLFLYGVSLIYAFSGDISYSGIRTFLSGSPNIPPGFIIGMILIVSAFAIKCGVVPFYMWLADVFEGAPSPASTYFSAAPMVASSAVLLNMLYCPFAIAYEYWQPFFTVISAITMLYAAFAIMKQENIKRFIAYLSIFNMGFVFAGMTAGSHMGINAVVVSIAIYAVINTGLFAVVLSMHNDDLLSEDIQRLSGIYSTNPVMAFSFIILLLSSVGFSPLSGFIAKYLTVGAVIGSGAYMLAALSLFAVMIVSVSCFKVIGIICFNSEQDKFDEMGFPVKVVLLVIIIPVIFMLFYPSPLLEIAKKAALDFCAVLS